MLSEDGWVHHFFNWMTQIIAVRSNQLLNSFNIKRVNLGSGTTIRFTWTTNWNLKNKSWSSRRSAFGKSNSTEQTKVIVISLVVSCLDDCNSLFFDAAPATAYSECGCKSSQWKAHDLMEDDLRKLHRLDVKKRIVFKLALPAHEDLTIWLCSHTVTMGIPWSW